HEATAVSECLPPQIERLVNEKHDLWRLHDTPDRRNQQHLGNALWQTVRVWLLLPQTARGTLVIQRLRPRLERHTVLEIAREIPRVSRRRTPDAREIGCAIRQTGSRSRQ